MIRIKHLNLSYSAGGRCYDVLKDINLEIAAGETCAIIGPSGCGKSTLLKILAGIITEIDGIVEIAGQQVRPKQQKIGFIPQNYGLLAWKNVYDNILLGAKIKGMNLDGQEDGLASMMQLLGLKGLEYRYPGELSGGQQQRVALARAFLLNPDLLLMDEPFSALDALTREDIQQVFLNVWRGHSTATVLVTHHMEEAVYLGRKIVIMSAGPGTISNIVENPLFGVADIRSKPEFFQLCIELRKMVKKDWAK
ncbi:ABC transporter ATP-binding protein|uniref:NitT/TauT family transport system ATP-binding protein n=1 Tax=Dendrosporobacter quercicolus TaxID=146817 RepID=A0A1G9WA41_9FIRM|nr:ABC transporter ATP-binding protein [Dendrosporobacter quercicolus]NSL47678.1 ABC transporter ATP-binding protein [Dendrosporobacter quercicolus DSM 1736]SDM81157.1 NitT/TauT family transport system ATP-binding protein [Dendrosporobacter quercicolus]